MTNEIDWSTGYVTKDSGLGIRDIKPNYNMTFHNGSKQIGALDFNGPEIKFEGEFDESAKIFFDWIAEAFKGRLEQERAAERDVILQMSRDQWFKTQTDFENAIRAREQS